MYQDCPGPERLALFLAGAGSQCERQEMEAHLADCRDCRRIIAMIVRSEAIIPEPTPPGLRKK